MMTASSPRTMLHDRYPELGRAPIPVAPFVSPQYFEREKQHIFQKTWLHVGRVEELPKTGSYFVRDLPACNASVLVVRTKQGDIRAMHNVCAHRMNRLVPDAQGCTRKLFCRFHGWAYELDGSLSGVPDEALFFDFDRKDYGLTPISVDTWQGFIFINLDRSPRETLKEFLSPTYDGIEGYPFEKFTSCYSWQAEINCNWKLALDAFQEAYHVAYVHGNSIAEALKTDEGGSLLPLDGECGKYHRRLSLGGNQKSVYGNPKAITAGGSAALEAVAGSAGARPIAAAALRHGVGGAKFEPKTEDLPRGLNWTRDPDWAFDINVVFPDFYLSLRPNYYQAYNFTPISHNKTRFDGRVYYPEMRTAGGRFYQEYMKCVLRDVLLEDWSTLEATQAACETGAKSHMILQDCELMVRHSNAVVERLISEGLKADQMGVPA